MVPYECKWLDICSHREILGCAYIQIHYPMRFGRICGGSRPALSSSRRIVEYDYYKLV